MSLSPTGGGGDGGQVGGGRGVGAVGAVVSGAVVGGGSWRQESPQRPRQEALKSAQFVKDHHRTSFLPGRAAFKWQDHRLEPGAIQLTHERVSSVTLSKQRGNLVLLTC